jgi:hypothetical protein
MNKYYGLQQPAKQDQYGRPLKEVDPALMQKIMTSEPQDNRGAFEQHDFYQGEDFVNYLYEQGIVPHWGNVQAPSGGWVNYLLGKMGVSQYGVNPFAQPYQPPAEGPARASYGGGGGGGGAGYVPAEPEPPKIYGSTRDKSGRNIPDWLQQMVVWNI